MSKATPTTLNGVIIVNKPLGLTSHDVVVRIRHLLLPVTDYLLPATKVGHTGTLDPFATGVLIIAIGSATRLIEYSHDWPKEYRTTLKLGASSSTDDKTGTITVEKNPPIPSIKAIEKVLETYVGPQQQLPPNYAAIKVAGKKLYQYARADQKVTRKPRPITIHQLKILDYNYPALELEVRCSTGTYIRALARDIGTDLQTSAFADTLTRTCIGKYHLKQALDLKTLNAEIIAQKSHNGAILTSSLPSYQLNEENVAQFKKGQSIATKDQLDPNKPLAIYNKEQQLIGIGTYIASQQLLKPNKVLP